MFLEGTFHVLLIYFLAGLILCLPPLILPQWKSLVHYFNRRIISHENLIAKLLLGFGIALSIVSIILITFYNPYLLGPQPQENRLFFYFFSFFSFILLPVGLGLIGSGAYVHYSSEPRGGNFFLVFISLSAIGLAGSFLHDFIWCGTITNFYTQQYDSTSYDLDWWRNLLNVESLDYRVFGFYMIILVIVLLCFAAVLLWKYRSFLEANHQEQQGRKILLLSILIVLVLAISLYVIDYKRFFTFVWAFSFTFVGIPLTVLLSFYLGKYLGISSNSRVGEVA